MGMNRVVLVYGVYQQKTLTAVAYKASIIKLCVDVSVNFLGIPD